MKLTFYIDAGDDAERCVDSLRLAKPISIEGEDALTGRIKPYEGVVVAIESMPAEALGERWRIAMETMRLR